MTITRRNVLLGATATAVFTPFVARAQAPEVVIGLLYPFSGAAAQQGVDSQKAYEAALDVINTGLFQAFIPIQDETLKTDLGNLAAEMGRTITIINREVLGRAYAK